MIWTIQLLIFVWITKKQNELAIFSISITFCEPALFWSQWNIKNKLLSLSRYICICNNKLTTKETILNCDKNASVLNITVLERYKHPSLSQQYNEKRLVFVALDLYCHVGLAGFTFSVKDFVGTLYSPVTSPQHLPTMLRFWAKINIDCYIIRNACGSSVCVFIHKTVVSSPIRIAS